MKRILAILCTVVVFATGIVGGYMLAGVSKNDVVGVYHTEHWNGNSATLIINEDGTCKYPSGGTGSWVRQGDVLELKIFSTVSTDSSGTNVFSSHSAYITEDGIVLYDCFFEKK